MQSLILMLAMLMPYPAESLSTAVAWNVAANSYYCGQIADLAWQVASRDGDTDLAEASQLVETAAQDGKRNSRITVSTAAEEEAAAAGGRQARKVVASYEKTPSREMLEEELVTCAQHL
jgi:hypothetical protein